MTVLKLRSLILFVGLPLLAAPLALSAQNPSPAQAEQMLRNNPALLQQLRQRIMALLFGLLQLPEGTVRAIAAWKEIGLALLVLTVFVRSITGRGPTSPIAWPDIWVSGLILTAILFLLTENLWLRFDIPAAAEYMQMRNPSCDCLDFKFDL